MTPFILLVLLALPQQAPAQPALPTIFVAGDSTAATGGATGTQGWGAPFSEYFDPARVNIFNGARGGRSSRTFITDGSWERIISQVKAGDFVLIQFGHNDGGAINAEPPGSPRPLRARGTLPGLGEEIEEIDNVLTAKHEVVHTYGWYMRRMISDVKAKGGTPILLSLTVRNRWTDGRIDRGSSRYGGWTREIAQGAGLAFIDLSNLTADALEKLGPDAVKLFYEPDGLHTNQAGATFNAAAVVAGLKALRTVSLAGLLSSRGAAIEAAPPHRVAEPPQSSGGFDDGSI